MAVYRVNKSRNYTVMSNFHLRDKNLSLKAVGLLSKMLSFNDGWKFSTRGLSAICKEGPDAILSALRELERHGYLVRHRQRDSKGRLSSTIFDIFEEPQPALPDTGSPHMENPDVDNPDMEKPHEGNPAQINTNFVLCYELISMITEKNNMHDMDTWMFFKWFFKAAVAIYLVTNTFDIVMAVFDIGQSVVACAAGVIHGTTNIDIASTLDTMRTSMEAMGVGELLGLAIETLVISLCLKIMSILITVILYGRMIEIYCTVSIAPIPIATMSNREWGSIGTNYLKGLFALAFQGFLIMICVGIYAVLINNMIIAANIHSALFSVAAYTVILCFSLFKTGSLSKSLFNAH